MRIAKLGGGYTLASPAEKHPAVFSAEIIEHADRVLSEYEWPGRLILDPFAGHGYVHELHDSHRAWQTTAVEIEPEWCAYALLAWRDDGGTETFCGDSRRLPREWARRFGAVFTSPCYGNRMADSHHANDKCSECRGTGQQPPGDGTVRGLYPDCKKCKGSGLSPRRSYTHDLGHELQAGNSGAMQWGDEYRALHVAVWGEVRRVLKPGGLFLLNVKDHVRNGEVQRVSEWHLRACRKLGFERESTITIPLSGMLYGENREARVEHEKLYVMRKP